jgi:riboflavin synthase
MFTGIIEHMGTVHARVDSPTGQRLVVDAHSPAWDREPIVGDSIAINGCCLTLAQPVRAGLLTFDVIPETLSKTTLGSLTTHQRVHIERAATMATLLGGHLVQGHIDGVARVQSVQTHHDAQSTTNRTAKNTDPASPAAWRVRIAPPPALMHFLAPQGSICVDGVSLTLAVLGPDWFEVALIPTTLAKTTLADLCTGSLVNIECDPIAKQVVHWLKTFGTRA